MAIMRRRDPFMDLTTMHRQIDDMFNSFLSQADWPAREAMPLMDVYSEADKELVTEIHLPGFSPEDVQIKVNDNILEISGQKRQTEEQKDKKRSYLMRQSSSSFFRTIALPRNAD